MSEPYNYDFFAPLTPAKPTARDYLRHSVFLAITFCTMTVAGILHPFGPVPVFADVDPNISTTELLLGFPQLYGAMISDTVRLFFTNGFVFGYGLKFSVSLILILAAHELGHYIACRIYRVDATLPYFIPTPPLIGPAGTFGAFIRIRAPMPSRRAIFDIGVAGPLAGFAALVPVALLAFATFEQVGNEPPATLPEGTLIFADPLLLHLFAYLFGINLQIPMLPNPYYGAAWIGLLVTALNLIPSGQLDGGHAVFAVFGERFHYWTGRIAFVVMIAFAVGGYYLYNSPSGVLFALLLGLMMRVRHPNPLDDSPLDRKRLLIALLTLIVFALSFTPFSIKIS